MIKPQLLEQVERYLEWRCLDKRWFDYRQRLGKPIDLRKLKCFEILIKQWEREGKRPDQIDEILPKYLKRMQDGLTSTAMGDDPPPITDAERAKTLETHRNYFANRLFALMEQKLLSEAEVATKARVAPALFDKLRNEKSYTPAERTIWALALAMELNFDEANNLLSRAPNPRLHYCLAANVMEEVLMAFFLDNRIYDLSTADELLTHYGFDTLEIREDFTTSPATKNFHYASLIDRIYLYIEENLHYMPEATDGIKFSYSGKHLGEPAESLKTFEVIVRVLKDKVGIAGTHFSDYLYKLIKRKNLTDVEVYKRAHLDRRIFSKIRNEKGYMPSKKTVMAIVFAMKLDFKEANTLLARAGYFLSEARKEDVITAYFIENQIYDLYLINEVLDYYDCPILGD